MSTKYSRSPIFHIENHKLVALGFNTHLTTTPIIFIHGITASINSWTLGPPQILAEYPWYSLSLPGHYPAEFPPNFQTDELTPELIARLLATAVSEITNGQPAIIIGHSTGGFAALAVVARYPELVAGLVCISGFVQGSWTSALGMLQKLARNGRFGQAFFNANFGLMARSKKYYQPKSCISRRRPFANSRMFRCVSEGIDSMVGKRRNSYIFE